MKTPMLLPLDQMIAAQPVPPPPRSWAAILAFLDPEAALGGSASTRAKTRSAARGRLRAADLTAEHAPLDLDWFDATFPVDGWDPTRMPFEQGTYLDYRNRVRPVIKRMLGAHVERAALQAARDGWTDALAALRALELFSGPHGPKMLIPIESTLTRAARRAGLQPRDLDQTALLALHADARKGERGSLQRASRRIAELQATVPDVSRWFPHPIEPIKAEGSFRYDMPAPLRDEVEQVVELASRRLYVRVKRSTSASRTGRARAFGPRCTP